MALRLIPVWRRHARRPRRALMIGAALVLRDLVQRRLGVDYLGLAAICLGAL